MKNYAEFFAGLGLGTLAIQKHFKDAKCKFYSEIEKNRNILLRELHPDSKNIGNVEYITSMMGDLPVVDFAIAGSPCQNLSIANTQTREGLDGHESGLFYMFLDYLKEKNPKYFLLENVASMDDDERNEITRCLSRHAGMPVKPVFISSYYFTGQIRERYYWANFPILPAPTTPVDPRHCIDKSVIPDRPTSDFINVDELYSAYKPSGKMKNPKNYAKDSSDWDIVAWSRSTRYFEYDHDIDLQKYLKKKNIKFENCKVMTTKKKKFKISHVEQRIKINMQANTLLTGDGCGIMSSKNYIRHKTKMRPLTPLECARLQGIPDQHIKGWSDRAMYKAIGDSFTLDVITHIMGSLKHHIENNS